MFNGILLVDKPAGISSFGVVARVRRILSQQVGKKVKVGHTGTLDPFATGLMILVVGKACKDAGRFSKLDKTYEALIELGKTSTTGDPEGEIQAVGGRQPYHLSLNGKLTSHRQVRAVGEVEAVLKKFTGEIAQTPPAYSAIKVKGQRAYKLARAGKEVEIPPRMVTIYSLELLDYNCPYLKIRAHVSSGTYIRTLAEDIGKALGTGAYTAELRRTHINNYSVTDALHISDETTAQEIVEAINERPNFLASN